MWRLHSFTSNKQLIESLRGRYVKSDAVAKAMTSVDRRDFTDFEPYEDAPQSIGFGVTISAPHMHGISLSLLEDYLKPGMKGSGYLTACMAHMIGSDGKVCGIEYIEPLMKKSLKNLEKDTTHAKWLKDKFIEIRAGDGWKGWPEEAPFNAIHVGAAADKIPENLVEQLASPGRLLCPVGPQGGVQVFLQIDKDKNGKVTSKEIFEVRYVPLVHPEDE